MISWKHSFGTLNEERETAEKKKQALDNLLSTCRISQSTYDLFSMEIAEAIAEIERREKSLLQKMNAKMVELEEQIKTLEILLANFEIQHVTGEIDEETYQREINVLSMGLETSRLELDSVKKATDQLTNGNIFAKQNNEPQATEVEIGQREMQKPTVELEGNEIDSTRASETDSRGTEASQSAEKSVEAKESQQA
jgi:hypothetical protein